MAFEFFGDFINTASSTKIGVMAPEDELHNFSAIPRVKQPQPSILKQEVLVCRVSAEWEGASCVYETPK